MCVLNVYSMRNNTIKKKEAPNHVSVCIVDVMHSLYFVKFLQSCHVELKVSVISEIILIYRFVEQFINS